MDTEPLSEKCLEAVRPEPGAYRIWTAEGELLWVSSSINDVKKALRHVYLGLQRGRLTRSVDTEVYRYLERYGRPVPVASLRFDYLITHRRQAKAQRTEWIEEYRATHGGQLPPLTAKE